jgi:hypothetical protein
MIPMGYMAKRTECCPGWPRPPQVLCPNVNDDFADYGNYWKHNCWWFCDSPDVIQSVAREKSIDLQGTKLFYYEAHELERSDGAWQPYSPGPVWPIQPHVIAPPLKHLEGFDVVTVWEENSSEPDTSPLASAGLANELKTNSHCLFETFEEAYTAVNNGKFDGCEPGALRIFAVYSVGW